MLRFDSIVFGPIHSRRLGNSLGINLLPHGGKVCNFDCIYCECGWNGEGRTGEPLPDKTTVEKALESTLKRLSSEGTPVDSITFSGHGEPTLHPEFAAIVDITISLRDRYCPAAKISVLSNATMLDRQDVFDALRKIDNPILKLDAPRDDLVRSVNRCLPSYKVSGVVNALKRFNGNFVLQTMFLKGAQPDYEQDADALNAWMDIVRMLHPRKVMAYTLDRPAPQQDLEKMSVEKMCSLLKPLIDEGFNIQING